MVTSFKKNGFVYFTDKVKENIFKQSQAHSKNSMKSLQ